MRKIAVLPTLLTLGNAVCGFVSITYASKIYPGTEAEWDHHFAMAGWFILLGMVFDMFDGYVARISKTASKFGGELDSLSDAISFGAAPAFLLLKMGPPWEHGVFLHRLLAGIAALYLMCTLLRLARFNVDNTPDPASHKRFRGLPSPGAAGCIAALAILRASFPGESFTQCFQITNPEPLRAGTASLVQILSPMGGLIVALLMVSNVPYPHITKQVFKGKRHVGHLIQVILAAFIILLTLEVAVVAIFWFYAILFPLRNLLVGKAAKEAVPRAEEGLPRSL